MMLSSLCQTIDDEIIIVYLPYLNRVISRWLIVKVDDFVGLSGGQSTSLIVSRSKRPTFSFVLLLLTLLIPLLSHLSFFFLYLGLQRPPNLKIVQNLRIIVSLNILACFACCKVLPF